MFYVIVQNYGSMFPVCREATMLYKEGSNPMERLYTIADSIIFQSTYQWFGNAVTPSWWTNVWMNGGVAEYLKHYIMDKVKLQFTNTYFHHAYEYECETYLRRRWRDLFV